MTFIPRVLYLQNGIPVIFQHMESPAAAFYWWVQVGSKDEGAGEEGFAHFLEHMLFKDSGAKETGKASSGKIARQIESFGGDVNAYTSLEQTVYHVTCAAQHWEPVLRAFGRMAAPQDFLKEDFTREKEVILEELRKNLDSPGRQLFEKLFAATFPGHPYSRPVIGYQAGLKKARVQELERFYRKQYRAEKMGLIVVGPMVDQQEKAVLKVLESLFGKKVLPQQNSVAALSAPGKLPRRPARISLHPFQVTSPSIAIAAPLPGIMHPDMPALDLLSALLGGGELSRLYRRLFYQESSVTDIAAGTYVPSVRGMFYIQAESEQLDQLPRVASLIVEEIQKLIQEGPTAEELERVVVNAASERIYAAQTADGLASRLGFIQFTLGDMRFDELYIAQLYAVTAEDIKRVARTYLVDMCLSGLVPKKTPKESIAQVVEALTRSLDVLPVKPRQVQLPRDVLTTTPKVLEHPSGAKIVSFERSGSQIISIHASVLGGVRLEYAQDVRLWGASHLLGQIWTKGTQTKDAQSILRLTEGRAASIEGFSGRNTIGLQMTALAKDTSVLEPLFAELLGQPSFPADELEHARRVTLETLRTTQDNPAQFCSHIFLQTLFEKHPYGRRVSGSEPTIAAIQSQDLVDLHKSWVNPRRLVLAISGPISHEEAFALGSRLLPDAVTAGGGIILPVLEKALPASRWVERHLGREQCHLIQGSLGITLTSPLKIAMGILQTILGGQSGRLFIELREKKSLAYTVAPMSFEGIETGYVGVYIASAPHKKTEALAGIQLVLEKLATSGPSVAEMKRAKEYYLGRIAMDLQSEQSMAAHMGLETLYGLPMLTAQALKDEVSRVTAEEVRALCERYFVACHKVTASVS